MARKTAQMAPLPSKSELIRFINESDGKVGKREIARAFNIRGADRPALKAMLRELVDEGLIERGRRKKVREAGTLPNVAVIEIVLADSDGILHARPIAWEADTAPPPITLALERTKGPAIGEGARLLARLSRTDGGYEARIIRRLPSTPSRVIGVLTEVAGSWRLMPTDRRQKFDLLVNRENLAGAGRGELVLAEIEAGRRLGLREARILERLGHFGDPRSMSLVAIHEHGIPVDFSPGAIGEAAAATPAALSKRVDLRDLLLVTIDGADARDFDDAVWAEADNDPKNPGGWRLVIAIADVAFYVRPESELDKAAQERGNSTYFPDRVAPMLPERLSNDLCCLRPDEDRAALTVTILLDRDGNKISHRFERAMIRSHARLTYEAVQAARDGGKPLPESTINQQIEPLYGAWNALMRARDRRQPLDLDLQELMIILGEDGRIDEVRPRPRLDSHRLIEEFMIIANVAAAEELERLRLSCMYRIHEAPSHEKLRALRDFLRTLKVNFSLGEVVRPAHFNRVLSKVQETEKRDVVNQAVLRAQAQAIYSPDNVGHFGLALGRYAHFTSPIRRYADLLVHRALIRGLDLGKDGLSDGEMDRFEALGEQVSMTERRSMAAERDAHDRYLAAYHAAHLDAEFDGTISGVTRAGLFVRLKDTGADGLVPISSIGSEYIRFEEEAMALVGERSGRRHRLGDTVRVRLVEADPITGSLNLRLADWREEKANGSHRSDDGKSRNSRRGRRGKRR